MVLYEQGKFKLDDDISQFLPFKVRNPSFPNTPITFRMLLTHTSSISDGLFFIKGAYWDTYDVIGRPDKTAEPLGEFMQNYFAVDGRHYDADVNFNDSKPGTGVEYSNVAFGLIGYLVEQISAQPFAEFCREYIFLPLGMTHSAWFTYQAERAKMAMPYDYNMFTNRYEAIGFYDVTTYPDGGLVTSTSEFMRFLYVFINVGKAQNGTTVLSKKTVDDMLRIQLPDISPIPGLAWANVKGKHMHSGTDPGVKALVMLSTQEKWGAIMFSNGGSVRAGLGYEIRDDFYDYLQRYGITLLK